ncbi:MAG TPA: energy-coupling factor transporter transmembrane component T [Microvirga sp.]|nr:energy-coupling factor transporter transmembrane component T [Microvirga sp.]
MIAGYLAHPTWLHRVPTGAKLALLAAASLAVLPIADPLALLAALGFTLLIYASLGRQAVSRLAVLQPLLPFLILIGALQAWFESWPAAVASTTRILLMILVASLVTLTTTMQAMAESLLPLMRPLRLAGINPRAPALAIALVIRFVPVLLASWQEREEAWRARTGRRASIRLIPAFVAETLRMADQIAEALDARGFDVLSRSRRAKGGPP